MGFTLEASGYPPTVRKMITGETLYVGQLLQTGIVGGTGGDVQIADAATETFENDHGILGVCLGVVDDSRSYDSTYRADKTTYTTTQATIAADGVSEVQVGIIYPWVTRVKAPICYTAFGTAPTVLTVTTASSGGTVVTHANDSITDGAGQDLYGTVYCRTGANRGVYRRVVTHAATSQTVTIPFPYGIAVGDTFVFVSCALGPGKLDIISTANCIDGDNDLDAFYTVFYDEINLERAGGEYAVFRFTDTACAPLATIPA